MGDKFKKRVKAIKNPDKKFYFLVCAGIGFGIAGMLLPPIGTIDWSVLILIGQLFLLSASVLGLEVKMNIKEGVFKSGDIDEEEK
jgi:hypothetical protein